MSLRSVCCRCMVLVVSACAGAPAKPPRLETFQLGLYRADYRDYRKQDICTAEPRWLLDELRSPLAIVGRFIDLAAHGPEHAWSEDELTFLDQGSRTLSPVLEVLRANLRRVQRCSFTSRPAFVALLRDGPPRCDLAEGMVGYVPSLLEYHRAAKARERWRRDQLDRDFEARSKCEAATKGPAPRVYYWVVECDGSQEWSFCDGARISRGADGGSPLWTPPVVEEPLRGRKRRGPPAPPRQELYFEAAKNHQQANRCPPLPPVPAPPVAPPTSASFR